MEEFEERDFKTFNQFFTRRFKPGARTVTQNPDEMPAFAEGRYLAFEGTGKGTILPVKGLLLSPERLLGDLQAAKPFEGGPAFVARLCPTDYHRFHYPDDGTTLGEYRVPGKLDSVNPIALRRKKEILVTNERRVSILQTRNFGRVAYVEVGATLVGRIIQSHPVNKPFYRGDEKGYFLFGASSIVLLGEPNAWKPDPDLIDQTSRGRETLVRLGERVARRF